MKTISLIISTYNNAKALQLILESILQQITLPDEIVVADDGSTQETSDLMAQYQKIFSIPLIHSWQEDKGFRISASKNKAISKTHSKYVILIDGDLVLDRYFIADFRKNIKQGEVCMGSRVFLTKKYTNDLYKGKKFKINFFSKSIEKNRINMLRILYLHKLLPFVKNYEKVRGAVLGIWKKDLIKVNGYDEDYTGWGKEDSDLGLRLLNNNIAIKKLKFCAVVYHLWHPIASRNRLNTNIHLLQKAKEKGKKRCNNGLDKYLE